MLQTKQELKLKSYSKGWYKKLSENNNERNYRHQMCILNCGDMSRYHRVKYQIIKEVN